MTILALSDLSTAIINPPHLTVVDEHVHTTDNPNYLSDGAQWIWNSQNDSWPVGYTNTFQKLFLADCPQTAATLSITADDTFTAYLNGVLVGTGNNWPTIYTFNVSVKCGFNNLTVIAINSVPQTPAALIFSVAQDQSNCYSCSNSVYTYYNREACQC